MVTAAFMRASGYLQEVEDGPTEERHMTGEKQIAIAQEFFQKSFRNEMTSAVELLAPDVTYHVAGLHRLAGTFEGPAAVCEHVGEFLRLTNNTVNILQWEDWMIGVNYLAALVRMRFQREGSIHTFRAIYLMSMSPADKIHRIELFFEDESAVVRSLFG
ncbi:MAG: hypothetical protein ACRDV4_05920 [Acidimicrobiales bacterium]